MWGWRCGVLSDQWPEKIVTSKRVCGAQHKSPQQEHRWTPYPSVQAHGLVQFPSILQTRVSCHSFGHLGKCWVSERCLSTCWNGVHHTPETNHHAMRWSLRTKASSTMSKASLSNAGENRKSCALLATVMRDPRVPRSFSLMEVISPTLNKSLYHTDRNPPKVPLVTPRKRVHNSARLHTPVQASRNAAQDAFVAR